MKAVRLEKKDDKGGTKFIELALDSNTHKFTRKRGGDLRYTDTFTFQASSLLGARAVLNATRKELTMCHGYAVVSENTEQEVKKAQQEEKKGTENGKEEKASASSSMLVSDDTETARSAKPDNAVNSKKKRPHDDDDDESGPAGKRSRGETASAAPASTPSVESLPGGYRLISVHKADTVEAVLKSNGLTFLRGRWFAGVAR